MGERLWQKIIMERYKILLVELAGIGDMVLSTPAIRNLRYFFPDAYIGLLTLPGPAELMCKSPYLDEVYALDKKIDFFYNLFVFKRLRRMNIEMLISLHQLYTKKGAFKLASLFNFLKVKKRVGRDTDGKGFFYDIKVADSIKSRKHDVEYKLDLIKAMGCDVKDRHLEVWSDDSDIVVVKEFLKENSISDTDILIGIHPGALRPSHRWDWQNFAYVADELAKRHKAKIIITGSKADSGLAKRISQKMSNQLIDTSGRFSLTQAVALIKRCHLYITNDTAPMHIANALKVPLVAIMGSGTVKTAPYQKENCIILRKNIECSPCYKFRCWSMRCLKNITVDMVIDASEKLLMTRWVK